MGSDTPFPGDLRERAICLDRGDRLVQALQRLGIALAHHQAHVAHVRRLVAFGQLHALEGVLADLVGQDRLVRQARLDAAQGQVARQVGHRVVAAHLLEDAFLLQHVEEHRAHLGAHHLALQVVQRGVGAAVVGLHDQAFAVGIDRVAEIHHLLARRRLQHGGRDDIDLAGGERGNQCREHRLLDVHGESTRLGHRLHGVHHHALDGVGLDVEEREGNARGGGADVVARGCGALCAGSRDGSSSQQAGGEVEEAADEETHGRGSLNERRDGPRCAPCTPLGRAGPHGGVRCKIDAIIDSYGAFCNR